METGAGTFSTFGSSRRTSVTSERIRIQASLDILPSCLSFHDHRVSVIAHRHLRWQADCKAQPPQTRRDRGSSDKSKLLHRKPCKPSCKKDPRISLEVLEQQSILWFGCTSWVHILYLQDLGTQ